MDKLFLVDHEICSLTCIKLRKTREGKGLVHDVLAFLHTHTRTRAIFDLRSSRTDTTVTAPTPLPRLRGDRALVDSITFVINPSAAMED